MRHVEGKFTSSVPCSLGTHTHTHTHTHTQQNALWRLPLFSLYEQAGLLNAKVASVCDAAWTQGSQQSSQWSSDSSWGTLFTFGSPRDQGQAAGALPQAPDPAAGRRSSPQPSSPDLRDTPKHWFRELT